MGLSLSPCHRRLTALQADGVITGYRAQVDAQSVGLGFQSLIFVTMSSTDVQTMTAFEDAVQKLPNIVSAQRLFGTPDFLLHVVAEDLAHFQEIYDRELAAIPGVQRLTSTLVMKSVVEDRGLPL